MIPFSFLPCSTKNRLDIPENSNHPHERLSTLNHIKLHVYVSSHPSVSVAPNPDERASELELSTVNRLEKNEHLHYNRWSFNSGL